MTTSFTPGPWIVRFEGRNKQEIIVRSTIQEDDEWDGGKFEPLIADLYRGGAGNLADARLIAAAPDQHSALLATQVLLEKLGLQSSDEYAMNAYAIAKATGEQA